ncbi:MAG: DNA polymerase III subunit alpha [Desulfobulbus sp.]|jgi:DNA polymerase-3 subunit alpha/error-prone DNA polymerase|nr:DNA polymerase III subunit alpha [Desulfobulbus sp.]
MIALGLHSHFSLLRGTASPRALCRRVRQLGYTAAALTDTNSLAGLWPFLAACAEEGLTPVIGAELRAASGRLFALVRDPGGYRHLCRLLSDLQADPALDLAQTLADRRAGLLLLVPEPALLGRCHQMGAETMAALVDRPSEATSRLRREAHRLGLPTVALVESFFLGTDDYPAHRLLRAIATNTSLARLDAATLAPANACLPSPAELAARFGLWPESLAQLGRIAEICTLRTPRNGHDLILPPWEGGDAEPELRRAALAGATGRYGIPLPAAVTTRLDHELAVINTMRFASYFLVVRDLVGPFSRTCGRGSGAASLVAYCLGITNVCPVRHNLYFARFLNPGRLDPPDIDIDFAWDERDQVLASVFDRFGCRAAMVACHVGLQPRMAIRETARVFGLPGDEIGRVTKRLPWLWRANPGEDGYLDILRTLPQLRGVDLSDPWPEILRLAARISGAPHHLSVHPGGVIITPHPVSDYAPVQRTPKGVPVLQWDKDAVEEAGLVKIDLLGNRSLGVIRDAIAQVRANGTVVDEHCWQPEEDAATRATLARGATMGCFYIESPATRLLQRRSGRGDFHHLVIHSSIIRPAANEWIREYLRRLHGGTWEPLHPLVAGVLDETYGIMVYQEDVSRVAVRFGFSDADADRLRKIMSKKDKHLQLGDYRLQFFAAAAELGARTEATEGIWAMMMSFAGYSFCKPHSASYAQVSFQAAWLKTRFPAEFMAAVISNRGGFYSTFAYVSEVRRLGLRILAPDVNASDGAWQGRGQEVRVGLMAVAGLGVATRARIVVEREQRIFTSVFDFLGRVRPEEDEYSALIQAGALDSLLAGSEASRAPLVWLAASWRKSGRERAPVLFPLDARPPPLPAEDRRERLRNEFRILGFLCGEHPITLFAGVRQHARTLLAREVYRLGREAMGRQRVRFLGWPIASKVVRTKSGAAMEFHTFEDETGLVECTLFPETYSRYCHLLDNRGPLLLEGYLEEEFGARTLTVERVAGARQSFTFSRLAA